MMRKLNTTMPFTFLVLMLAVFCLPAFGFQTPGFFYDEDRALCDLANKSDLIVTGRVNEARWVIDPVEKEKEYKRWNDLVAENPEKLDLAFAPKPSKYVIGFLYTIELSEILYSGIELKYSDRLSVYVKGYPRSMHTKIRFFSVNSNYLLHLLEGRESDFDLGAVVWKPVPDAVSSNFDLKPGETFVLTPGEPRFPPLTSENTELIDKAERYVTERETCADSYRQK